MLIRMSADVTAMRRNVVRRQLNDTALLKNPLRCRGEKGLWAGRRGDLRSVPLLKRSLSFLKAMVDGVVGRPQGRESVW